jgi:hypothetical protein
VTLTPNFYQIVLKDANGVQLCPKIDNYVSLEYTRSANNIGACKLVMSDSDIIKTVNSWDKFKIDGRLEIWKSLNGGPMYLDGESFYLIRKVERNLSAQGEQTMTFTGQDTVSLLGRRTTNVNPLNATVNITVADYADDVLKDLFKNYLGSSAGAGFDLSAYIAQQIDLSHAAQITKQFNGRSVLQTMQEICQASANLGIYLAFDIVSDGSAMEFRTYTGQRGKDRRASTGNALLIGPEVGNVLSCHFEDDHTDEATYLVNGSQAAIETEGREGISPFGRIMKMMSSSASGSTAQLLKDAQAQLRFNRSKKVFTAEMIQTEGCLYGKHYNYGDYITCSAWGQQFDAHLDALDVRIQNGEEQVNCVFRGEYQAWL